MRHERQGFQCSVVSSNFVHRVVLRLSGSQMYPRGKANNVTRGRGLTGRCLDRALGGFEAITPGELGRACVGGPSHEDCGAVDLY